MSDKKAKVFIAEDDESIRRLLQLTLSMEGYETEEAEDGVKALTYLTQKAYDLVLLDIMLPGMDGVTILSKLPADHPPVIFLTAKSGLSDKVMGLRLGADDYITKPFEPLELVARIEVVLRREQQMKKNRPSEQEGQKLQYGTITLDEGAHKVLCGDKEVVLTAREYDLLLFLLRHQNQILSRDQLLSDVWGYDYFGGTRTVDVHVKNLRSKLNLNDKLETVYKVGYRLKKLP